MRVCVHLRVCVRGRDRESEYTLEYKGSESVETNAETPSYLLGHNLLRESYWTHYSRHPGIWSYGPWPFCACLGLPPPTFAVRIPLRGTCKGLVKSHPPVKKKSRPSKWKNRSVSKLGSPSWRGNSIFCLTFRDRSCAKSLSDNTLLFDCSSIFNSRSSSVGEAFISVGSVAANSFTRSAYLSVFNECSQELIPGLIIAICEQGKRSGKDVRGSFKSNGYARNANLLPCKFSTFHRWSCPLILASIC